ncbi:S-layer homology domain-containing protein [Candidatus Margulisiibacteriota bacterium]
MRLFRYSTVLLLMVLLNLSVEALAVNSRLKSSDPNAMFLDAGLVIKSFRPQIKARVFPAQVQSGRVLLVEANVNHPVSLHTLEAEFPDNTKKQLSFDEATKKWVTTWEVPASGVKRGEHVITITAIDIDGSVATTKTNPFSIFGFQPSITKLSVPDKTITYKQEIIVSGSVKNAASLSLNGQIVPFDENTGKFEIKKELILGKNTLRLEVLSQDNQLAKYRIRVLRLADFRDVDKDYFSSQEITNLATLKVFTGYNDNTFRPDREVRRIEMAVLLSNLKNLKLSDGKPLFKDVPEGYWGTPYIKTVVSANYMSAYSDNNFRPLWPVTRISMMTILARVEGLTTKPDQEPLIFEDVPRSHWGYPSLKALMEKGLITGRKGTLFYPREAVKRSILSYWLSKTSTVKEMVKDLYNWDTDYGSAEGVLQAGTEESGYLESTVSIDFKVYLPHDKTIVFNPELETIGIAKNVHRLLLNSRSVPIDDEGGFYKPIKLKYGKNSLLYMALDETGRKKMLNTRILLLPSFKDLDTDIHKYMLGYLGVLVQYHQDKIYPAKLITEQDALDALKNISKTFRYTASKTRLTRKKAVLMCSALIISKMTQAEREELEQQKEISFKNQQIFIDLPPDQQLHLAIDLLYKKKVIKRRRFFYPDANVTQLEWFKLITKLPVVRSRIKRMVNWKRDYHLLSDDQINEILPRKIPGDDFDTRALRLFPSL